MLRCLHLADLHLGWSASWLGSRAASYAAQRDKILERLSAWILNDAPQLDLILIVGDLFENHRPPAPLVEQVLAELNVWVEAGMQVITVPGNHDEITYHDSVYQRYGDRWPGYLVTNPQPGPPQEFVINGQRLYLYSLAYTGGLTEADAYLQPYPRTSDQGIHLAALHGSLDWLTEERGLPLSSRLLAAAAYDYVALGHFHRPQQLRLEQTLIAYAGAIASKGFNDIGCGQLALVALKPRSSTVEWLPWQPVDHRVLRLDVGRYTEQEELVEAIKQLADPQLLLRVELEGAAGFLLDSEALASRLARHFYLLQVREGTLQLAADLQERWAQETTMRGLFVRRMQAQAARAQDERARQVVALALRRGIAAFLQEGQQHD